MLYEINGISFHLFGTKPFRVKAENEIFSAACLRQNLRVQNFMTSFGTLRQRNVRTCVLHDYFSWFNKSYDSFVVLKVVVVSLI